MVRKKVKGRSWSGEQCEGDNHRRCENQMQRAQEGRWMMNGEVIDDGWR
jgi:hypothetical protein